jgi:signal transduction histidine kinase
MAAAPGPRRVLLIHGAWHGAWCWERMLAPLRALRHEPEAIELPGHGKSTEPLTDLHGDADAVRARLDAIGEPTLLVGHSYGGMVITDAGAHDAVAGLAHVAAYLPDSGRRCWTCSLVAAVRFSDDRSEMRLQGDGVAGALYRDCDPATQQWAIARLDAQSTVSFTQAPGSSKDLADTVDGLLGRLETAFDAQKRFVANAAHELRTPLTLEHALLEETLTDSGATLASFRSTSERVLAISEQQGRLLEALLTPASSERGLDRREPFDLSALTHQALRALGPQTDRLGVRVETRIAPAPTSGDPALVERLVANLLDNAVRYNLPGGRVEVTTATKAERAVLSIAKTGPVFPPAQVDRLFEPFQRLSDRTTRNDGHHGLGLSIVRAIATAHHATLTASARSEGGLVVEIGFPVGSHPLPGGGP